MATWLPAGLSAALVLSIGVAFFSISRAMDAHQYMLTEVLDRTNTQRLRFQMSLLDEVATWHAYQENPTPQTLERLRALREQTRRAFDDLNASTARAGPEFAADFDTLRNALDRWEAAPVAVMNGRMSLEAFKQQQPQQQSLLIDVMTDASRLGARITQGIALHLPPLRRLARLRVQILAGLFPLALLGIALTAWFARRATSTQQRLLEISAQDALVRDAMAALIGDQVFPEALNRIATNAMRLSDADGAFIEQSNEARDTVEIVAAVGSGVRPAGTRLPFVDSITDHVVRGGATERPLDLAAREDELGRLLGGQANHAFALAVPMSSSGDVDGALVLVRRDQPIKLRNDTQSRLQTLGAWAALALRRQRLATQLESEHKRLEAVLEEMPLGVVLAEAPSGRLTLFNRHASDIWGSPASLPQSVEEYANWQLFHPNGQEYEVSQRPLARSILTGETVRGEEAEIERPGGERRAVRVNSAPIRDERGAIIAGVVTIDDIAEEKRKEREARFLDEISRQLASTLEYDATMEAILQLMVPRMGDAAAVHHLEGNTIVRRWGASIDDGLMRERLAEVDRDPMPLRSAHPVAVAVRTGESQLREVVDDELLKAVAPDEHYLKWVRTLGIQSAMAVPLVVRARPIGALLFLSMDPRRRYTCEDLRLAEEIGRRAALAIDNAHLFQTLNRSEQTARFLADSANALSGSLEEEELVRRVTRIAVPVIADFALAYVVNEDGRVRNVASAHRDPERRATLEDAARLYHPDPKNPRATVPRALRTAQPVLVEHVTPEFLDSLGLEPRVREVIGELAPVSWVTVPLVAQGVTLGAMLLASVTPEQRFGAEDLTIMERFAHSAALAMQNARLYRTVEDAVAAREEVLAIVSHDLRNPLSTINMAASLLGELPLEDGERARHLEVIRRASERMNRLIQDLLDVTRAESGKPLVLERRRVHPSVFIREACESFALKAREKRVRLEWTVGDEIPDVSVDVGRVVQVLSNLIGNALKFTPEGGQIGVRADRDGTMIRVSVKDSGPGIAAEDLERIFRPFWQAPRSAREGTGLGLPIARVIIEHHGGRVWAESKEGVGSTFYFTLPEAQEAEARAA